MKVSLGAFLINEERFRQVYVEGYTPERDRGYFPGELSLAATAYAKDGASTLLGVESKAIILWPWALKHWKPSDDPLRTLVKAGALICAEIEKEVLRRQREQKGLPSGGTA